MKDLCADALAALRDADPASDPAVLGTHFDAHVPEMPMLREHHGRRRRWLVPVAALVVAATAAAGWAVARRGVPAAVLCPENTIIDARTTDPAEDCARMWEDVNGTEAPPMRAYTTPEGWLEVVVDGDAVPAGSEPVPSLPADAEAVLELRSSLEDHAEGLPARCHTVEEAVAMAERELDRLGLRGWRAFKEDGPDMGADACTELLDVDADTREVRLLNWETFDAGSPIPFAGEVGGILGDECLDLQEASARIRLLLSAQAAETGADSVTEIVDDAASCTRGDVLVGGSIEVVLRGPAAG